MDAAADGATQHSVRRTIVFIPGLAIPPTPGARKEMTRVREELQVQITVVQERILAAIEADDPYEVARHRARLATP